MSHRSSRDATNISTGRDQLSAIGADDATATANPVQISGADTATTTPDRSPGIGAELYHDHPKTPDRISGIDIAPGPDQITGTATVATTDSDRIPRTGTNAAATPNRIESPALVPIPRPP